MSWKSALCLVLATLPLTGVAVAQVGSTADLNSNAQVEMWDIQVCHVDHGRTGSPGFSRCDFNTLGLSPGTVDRLDWNQQNFLYTQQRPGDVSCLPRDLIALYDYIVVERRAIGQNAPAHDCRLRMAAISSAQDQASAPCVNGTEFNACLHRRFPWSQNQWVSDSCSGWQSQNAAVAPINFSTPLYEGRRFWDSPSHRASWLDARMTHIGLAEVHSAGNRYLYWEMAQLGPNC